jgi:Cu-Zn family superoxide dismutase
MDSSCNAGRRTHRLRIAAVLGLAGACALAGTTTAGANGGSGRGAQHATASIVDSSGTVIGTARFTEDASGVLHVNVHVHGLSPGLHGTHIHEIGLCTPTAFTSAGGHHNPLGASHGTESAAPTHPHAGDLPNLVVSAAGVGHLDTTTTFATLSTGPTSVLDANGSALVIHALEDDLMTNPTGNSGARVGCGVIED